MSLRAGYVMADPLHLKERCRANAAATRLVPCRDGAHRACQRRQPSRLRDGTFTAATPLALPDAPVARISVMSLGTILVIILILVLLGVIPNWGYSSGWGYGPSGIVGTILVIVLILLLLGRI